MEETIYQDVWCRVFADVWRQSAADPEFSEPQCGTYAGLMADKAAAAAVRQWDESKRLAAIVAKNKGGK